MCLCKGKIITTSFYIKPYLRTYLVTTLCTRFFTVVKAIAAGGARASPVGSKTYYKRFE